MQNKILRTLRGNSKRNPWRNNWADMTKRKINVHRLVALLLLLSIPAFCIGISSGILARSADVYQYNLKSTQAIENGTRFISEDELVALVGDFMTGKTDRFELLEEVEYEPENVFTEQDEKVMTQYRSVMQRALAAGVLGALVTLAVYGLLIYWKEKDLTRWIMGLSGVSLLFFVGLHITALVFKPMRLIVYGRAIDFALPEKDYLAQLAGQSFAVQFAVMTSVAAVVLFLLMVYLTFRLAGKHKVFRRSVWAEPPKK